MAKQDDDDLNDFRSGDASDIGPGSANTSNSGIWTKLPAPVQKLFEGIRGFFENIVLAVSSAFNDKERPFMPMLMLGGAILVLLMLVIVMVAILASSMGAKPDMVKTDQSGPERMDTQSAAADSISEMSPDSTLVRNGALVDLGLKDSFLGQPILPDEPKFMLQGEIQYHRMRHDFWELSDIKPGWQDLGALYRTMLREHNHEEFYRLMGEIPPPSDRY